MRCEDIQQALSRYLTDELSLSRKDAISKHLEECADCREALMFHRSLAARLDGSVHVPSSLEKKVLGADTHTTWMTRVFGDPTMKRIAISTTAVTALVLATALFVPRSANASTPVESLKKLRSALATAMHDGELTLNATADKNGSVTISGTLDGNPLPDDFPMTVHVTHEGNVSDIHVTVDLSPDQFKSIEYGADKQTLLLTPKNKSGVKYSVGLDKTSSAMKSWTTLVADKGAWATKSKRVYQPKATSAPKADSDVVADVHIKIMDGQDGTIRVSKGG